MYDLIIIGAGPAGLTSALYASRAGLKVLILEKAAPGGKVFLTHLVENYPGFESITGRELAQKMHKHALEFGAEYKFGNVEKIESVGDIKTVYTQDETYQAKNIVLATGTENRKLGVKGEEELLGHGVSYCAVCDGNFFKEKDVMVIGGGNSAIEEALYLSELCKTVTIVHRRHEFRAEPHIVENLKKKDNITYKLGYTVNSINGEDKVKSISLNNISSSEEEVINTDGVFIYVGLIPVTNLLETLGLSENNLELSDTYETKIKGVYVAGDLRDKKLRQITTASSDGAIVAQAIINSD
ncbi:MAG: thioredoxin-disulfide reductase [Mycoplasmatales bacterium]